MRKRNHVIPLHLNKRELEYLEAQTELSGQPHPAEKKDKKQIRD